MLCLLERPSQPVNFNITSEDDTSLMLIWSEPVNTKREVDYYIVSTVATIPFCDAYYNYHFYLGCYNNNYIPVITFTCRFTTVMVHPQRLLMCTVLMVHTFLKISHHPHNTVFM